MQGDCPLTVSRNLSKDQLDREVISPVMRRIAFEHFALAPFDLIAAAKVLCLFVFFIFLESESQFVLCMF